MHQVLLNAMPLRSAGLAALLSYFSAQAADTVVVFVAGLEGTGHHYFDDVFQALGAEKIELKGDWNFYGMEDSGQAWSKGFVEENVKFLQEVTRQKPGKVLWIYAAGSGSYPNGHGTHEERMHMHPRLPLLMEAAERGGANVQVLVTLRGAGATLAADCLHRHDLDRSCKLQAETLAKGAETLAAQLGKIDPSKFRCVSYGDFRDLGLGLANALVGHKRQELAHEVVMSAWEKDAAPTKENIPEVAPHVKVMEDAVEQLAAVCKEGHAGPALPVHVLSKNSRVDSILQAILPRRIVLTRQIMAVMRRILNVAARRSHKT